MQCSTYAASQLLQTEPCWLQSVPRPANHGLEPQRFHRRPVRQYRGYRTVL